jgi:hypothetical protein
MGLDLQDSCLLALELTHALPTIDFFILYHMPMHLVFIAILCLGVQELAIMAS